MRKVTITALVLVVFLMVSPLHVLAQEPMVTSTVANGLVLVQHPEGWGIEAGSQQTINIANDPAMLEAIKEGNFEISSGQVGLSVFFIPVAGAVEQGVQGSNSEERAAYLAALLTSEDAASLVSIGEVERIAHEGQPTLARFTYSYGDVFEGMNVVWDISEDTIGIAVVMTSPGESTLFEETVYAILESVTLNWPVEAVLSPIDEENE
jgi:hypothetical protein